MREFALIAPKSVDAAQLACMHAGTTAAMDMLILSLHHGFKGTLPNGQDLAHVDEALLDIGNRIAKAERYFPACEASAHPAANAAADQAEGAQQKHKNGLPPRPAWARPGMQLKGRGGQP